MALIGPNPTPASVVTLLRDSSATNTDEVLAEVVHVTDGPILTHLAANKLTRPRLGAFLAPRLPDVLDDLRATSDRQFVALSWLADECPDLRQPIVDLVAPTLAEHDRPPAALTVLTRLLAKGKLDRAKLDASTVTAALPVCASDDQHWRLLATVFLKDVAATHKHEVEQFVKDRITAPDAAAQTQAFAAVEAVGDVVPEIVTLVWTVPAETQDSPSPPFLRMLSVLCNTKDDRDRVAARFGRLVARAADAKNERAAVVDAKILAGTTSPTGDVAAAAARLDTLSRTVFEPAVNDVTLEGLVCTAPLPSVRKRATTSKPLVTALCRLAEARDTAFVALSVLYAVAKYPIKPTKDEQKQTQLRIQTLGKSPADAQADDDTFSVSPDESGKVCDYVLAAGLVNWLAAHASSLSSTAREQIALLLRELAYHQDRQRRQSLATQGAVIVAAYLWITDKLRLEERKKTIIVATIAKVLASVVPQIALTSKVSPNVVVEPLVEQVANEHSERQNLDTFEALRALTNLSSIDDARLRLAISVGVWPRLTSPLNSEYLPVQRSAIELVCNLMTVSNSAQRFLYNSSQSQGLLSLLGQAVVMDDRDTRLAGAGSLAILANWDTAPEAIGNNRDCVVGISNALALYTDDNDMLIRVLNTLILLIKGTAKVMNDEVIESIIHFGGAANLEALVDTIDTEKYYEASRLILKCIQLLAEYKLNANRTDLI